MKKKYIIPAMESVTLHPQHNLMALSGVNETGTKVGFSENSGNVNEAASKSSGNWSGIWDE